MDRFNYLNSNPITNSKTDITEESVASIALIPQPVLRNLLITQCYCELSNAFARRMGSFSNWCTFATWASKQAGQTIRHEDLERKLQSYIQSDPEIEASLQLIIAIAKRVGATKTIDQIRKAPIASILNATAIHAATAVSRGNKKVFEEIGKEFSRFGLNCLNDSNYDQQSIDGFLANLKPGPPPEGQDYLREAFKNYYQAIFTADEVTKRELNFLANLLIGLHEQTRLQPEIIEALSVPLDKQQIKKNMIEKLFAGAPWWASLRYYSRQVFGTSLLDQAIENLLQLLQARVRSLLTEHLMTMTIPPGNILCLNKDLSEKFSSGMEKLSLPRLTELLKQIDPTADSLAQSGATDWSNLSERMHYIADLFRCYHVSKELFEDAFTAEQIESIKKGIVPGGRL